jgi:hypothetical protein
MLAGAEDDRSKQLEALRTEIWADVLSVIAMKHGHVWIRVKRKNSRAVEVVISRAYSKRSLLSDEGRDVAEPTSLEISEPSDETAEPSSNLTDSEN